MWSSLSSYSSTDNAAILLDEAKQLVPKRVYSANVSYECSNYSGGCVVSDVVCESCGHVSYQRIEHGAEASASHGSWGM